MQLLLDHLASVAIAGLFLLAVLALQTRGNDASIEATQFNNTKTRMLSLAAMVERDFTNIGSGVDSVAYAITSLDTTSATRRFVFLARTDTADAAAHTVTYEWEAAGSAQLTDTTLATYTVKRIINGYTSGQSVDSVTSFGIKLFNSSGIQITTNYADTRFVNVSVTAVSTLGVMSELEQSRWNKSFRPINLTRGDN
jgi:Tfp pilus assembly protein PilE